MGLLLLLLSLVVGAAHGLPVVLWHGMGDSCCDPLSMGRMEKLIKTEVPGTFVYSVRIGRTDLDDVLSGFFEPAWKQVNETCAALLKVPELRGGFDAIGFSQGGQFLRALVQQCSGVRVRHLITLGGQHQGVYGLPKCLVSQHPVICEKVRLLLDSYGVYSSFLQEHLTQAEYWQDADNETDYLLRNRWLPSVNGHPADPAQKARLLQLERFVMVKFENDTMVQPRISSHFGWYSAGSSSVTVPLNATALYTDPADVLGLRQLDQAGKLVFLQSPGDHLQFTDAWFVANIVPYLGGQM